MFSKSTPWSLCFATTFVLLTACGGGDHTDAMAPTSAPLAASSHLSAGSPGAATANASGSVTADAALEQPQVLTAATIESTTVTMHGASAAILTTTVASDQERLLYEQGQIDYERSYSIEMNRRHEEQLAREKAGEAALQEDAAIGAECQQAYGVACPKIGG